MKFATFAFSFIGCAASVATLAVVIVGGKQMKDEMDELRDKTNKTVMKFRTAINEIDL